MNLSPEILLVEDNARLAALVAEALGRAGCEVRTEALAASVEAARLRALNAAKLAAVQAQARAQAEASSIAAQAAQVPFHRSVSCAFVSAFF
jgi:DNA-binding response OmpR family regulator